MAATQPEQQGESNPKSSSVAPWAILPYARPTTSLPSGGRRGQERGEIIADVPGQSSPTSQFFLAFMGPLWRLGISHPFALPLSLLCHVKEIAVSCPYHRRHSHACCRWPRSPFPARLITDLPGAHLDQPSPGLLLNLPSNNPFRNRAVSPALSQSPVSPFDDPPPRPLSRNPFLDPAITSRASFSNIRSTSEAMSFDKRPSLTADEIFVRRSHVGCWLLLRPSVSRAQRL